MENKQKTKIDGLEITNLNQYFDDRGCFYEVLHNHEITKFARLYTVTDPVRGTIRGFHKHKLGWDNFCIVAGSAKFVFVDDRENSPTYKQQETIVTSARAPQLIIVPPGVYHGWISLEDNTILITENSELFDKENPDDVRIPADSYGDVWTTKGR
jgi:dTDP-4-dehydrorhamnose 3,5-epimerase